MLPPEGSSGKMTPVVGGLKKKMRAPYVPNGPQGDLKKAQKRIDPDPYGEIDGPGDDKRVAALKRRMGVRAKPALKSRGNIGGAIQALKPQVGNRMPRNGGAKGINPPGGGYQLMRKVK